MSKPGRVTITITEDGDSADMRIEADPPFPGPAAKNQRMNAAQRVAMQFLDFVGGQIEKRGSKESPRG